VPTIFPFKVKPASKRTRVSLGLHHNIQHSEALDEASLTSEGVSSSLMSRMS